MGLLDYFVDPCFRNEKAGRVVVLDRRDRGYLVRSPAEELKIRSFLKMYRFADLVIRFLGLFLTLAWLSEFHYRRAELFRDVCIFTAVYSVIALLPELLLARSYKKELLSFVSPQDEVSISGKVEMRQKLPIILGVVAASILAMVGIILLTWSK